MRSKFLFVCALFLVSGATGLLYEVAFLKILATIFGATAYAISTVLSAFMAGLALGAFVGGRLASRVQRPLAAYGVAELFVGFVCAATPSLFSVLSAAYVSLAVQFPSSLLAVTALRAGLTFLVILLPTTCMGATLPLLARHLAGEHETRGRLPVLYSINTLGGAVGSMSAAYFVLPALGVSGTMRAAALVNVVIGVIALLAGRAAQARSPEEARKEDAPSEPLPKIFLLFAFGSGLLVFAAEVVETHLLTLLIGNSAYAFGLMLATFLVCLAVGASRAPAFARRFGDQALAIGLAASSLTLVATLPIWDKLPHLFAFAGKHVFSWSGREACRAIAAFVVLAIPTLCMGTTFSLLLARIEGKPGVARNVGTLTVANTLGTIVGSTATGYFVLPLLGSQRTLTLVAVLFALLAVVGASRTVRAGKVAVGVALATCVLAAVLPRWNLAQLTNGANVYFTHGPPPDEIPFVREDVHGGVTTVARRGSLLTLYTNGKFQGDDGGEMRAQQRFAHYPAIFAPRYERALVIGLGTGVTLGAVATYPFTEIDVAEISPAIVEAARLYYAEPARHSLDDPRVKLSVNDGRNELLLGRKSYDLITIELSSIWFAGASAIYSQDFYHLARERLTEGGVLQQWVQLHHLRPRELASIIKTLRSVFTHVALFEGGSQGILVASQAELLVSRGKLAGLEQRAGIRETLDHPHLADLLDELIVDDADIDRYVADVEAEVGPVPISTDDNLFLEYATPKGNVLEYHSSLAETLARLRRYKTGDPKERHLLP